MVNIDEMYIRLLGKRYQSELFRDLERSSDKPEGREIRCQCPFCDSSKGFSYNLDRPVWRCWKCLKAGNWIKYLEERYKISTKEAIAQLAKEAGMEAQLSDRELRDLQSKTRKAEILETAQEFFVQEMTTPEATEIQTYLVKRGYSQAQVTGMELGAYTSRAKLTKYLKAKGYTQEEISKAGLLTKGFGETHTLSLLWRDSAGRATGLVCRTIQQDTEPKYKYSYGLSKTGSLLGLERARGQESVTLVEGIMDSKLLASVYGKPVLALGGTALSEKQVRALELNGTKQVTLAMDSDKAGQDGIAKALKVLSKSDKLRAYVVSYPPGYKDADELVRQAGLEAFEAMLKTAGSQAGWYPGHICSKYDLETDRGLDTALAEAFGVYTRLKDGIDKQVFYKALKAETGLDDTQLAFRVQEQEQRASESKIQQTIKDIATKLQERGSRSSLDAEITLSQALQDIRQARGHKTPEPYLLSDFTQEIAEAQPGLKTGFRTLDELVTIPPGALSIIAGRPGHGKTSLMLNLLVNFVQNYPSKSFYLFSYEEAKKYLALKLVMIRAGVIRDSQFNQEAYINYIKYKRDTEPNEKIEKALQEYDTWSSSGRLVISDDSYKAQDLAGVISQVCQAQEVGGIIIDYVQKIPVASQAQRYLDIKDTLEQLLEQAKAYDVPIILGAQLGRDSSSSNKVHLSNLRESGDIEQDANLVLGLHNKSEEDSQDSGQQIASQEVDIKVTVLKQRGGIANRYTTLTFDRPILKLKSKSSLSNW